MIWVMGLIVVCIIYAFAWLFLGGVKKVNSGTEEVYYTFRYYIYDALINDKELPVKFLVNWNISELENHLYILNLILDHDLLVLDYLKDIWKGYHGKEVIIGVYKYDGEYYDPIGVYQVVNGGKVNKMMKE